MIPVPLEQADQEDRFGGKAVQLGAALRAGLPVPAGFALEVSLVAALATGDASARARCRDVLSGGGRVAVRSSAVGEDSERASFAGQHLTVLNVADHTDVLAAVAQVWESGRTAGALAYRERLGVTGEPRVGVVLQEMVDADCAGVMFTRNPIDGSDERVIEVAWGLGEAVVAGLVEPDRIRMRRGGRIVEHTVGDKDVAIAPAAGGRTDEVAVSRERRRARCLDDRRLGLLEQLAARCEAVFSGAHDLEFAFAGERLFLLQRRAVTR